MTGTTHSMRRGRSFSMRVLLASAAGVVTLSVPAVAYAASPPSSPASGGTPSPRASSICANVSAASISAIVGYKVPAGTATVFKVKPTKANFGISGVNTVCTYGVGTTMAALLKDVSLTYEVISKPVTTAEIQQQIKAESKGAIKYTFVPYTGLGVPGFYFSLTEAGITGQGIAGVQNGTHYFGASVESKTVSKSSLAALAKLAEKL
jgi:hypothetical protein